MCISTTTETRHVILDFDIVSEIITFEEIRLLKEIY